MPLNVSNTDACQHGRAFGRTWIFIELCLSRTKEPRTLDVRENYRPLHLSGACWWWNGVQCFWYREVIWQIMWYHRFTTECVFVCGICEFVLLRVARLRDASLSSCSGRPLPGWWLRNRAKSVNGACKRFHNSH